MKESDIRPQKLFDELLRLNKLDVETYFNNVSMKKINCPACGSKGKFSFIKNNFSFDECEICKTLYVSPRPDKNHFDAYYKTQVLQNIGLQLFIKRLKKVEENVMEAKSKNHKKIK